MFDSENGDFDIQKKHINDKGEYVITAGLTDNGVLGKTDVKAKIFDEDTITVDMFGYAFFRQFKYKIVTHARVFSLIPKIKFSKNIGLVITSALGFLPPLFGYENMCSWNKIKDLSIQLPTKNGKIDFGFMESFIVELEAQRIAELEAKGSAKLEAYLTAADLKDYELTEEERACVERFDNIEWTDVKFDEIFNNIKQGRRLKKADQLEGNIPFVMAGVTNTGISKYISNPIVMFPKDSITVDIFGNTFFRNYDFSAGDDTGVYWNDEKNLSENALLFISASVGKSLLGKFSYGHKLRSSRSKKISMKLPLKNDKIDLTYMETLIQAIKKLVIKDLVLYTDQKIGAAKKILAKE